MSATISRSSAIGNPSSMTNAADSHCGRAPDTARSLTVPCTATWPIEPPGKARRQTTKQPGGEREPFARRCTQRRRVAELFEFVVAERLEEHRVDKRRRRLAAGTVRERHHIVEQARAALPELVDALQHAVFALGGAHCLGHKVCTPFRGRAMCC